MHRLSCVEPIHRVIEHSNVLNSFTIERRMLSSTACGAFTHHVHLNLIIITHCSLKDLHRRYVHTCFSIHALVHQDAHGTCLPYFRIYSFILAYVIGRWRKDEKRLRRTTQPHSRRRYENPQRAHRSGGCPHESIKL